MNAESADSNKKVSSVVIEELDVLAKSEPIRNLEIVRTMQYGKLMHQLNINFYLIFFKFFVDHPRDGSYDDGKLVIVTDSQVVAIKLHR